MGIKIRIDTQADAIEVLENFDPAEFSEALVEGITDAVYEEARKNAIGLGGQFGQRIARSLRTRVDGMTGIVSSDGADGYIGLHVHQGGPVRSRNGKMLAIPTRYNDQKDVFASDRNDLMLVKSRRRCYLFKKRRFWMHRIFKKLTEPGAVLGKPLYVLTRETKPQKPRPWWPDESRVRQLAEDFARENF